MKQRNSLRNKETPDEELERLCQVENFPGDKSGGAGAPMPIKIEKQVNECNAWYLENGQ